MFSPADDHWMRRALALAEQGLWTTTPNPRVGCVIVRDGQIVGEAWHQRAGEPHAEALALAQAEDRAHGATAYVTLEPCSHTGRTPPCADALIRAGIKTVVAAMEDPNPLVNGHGLARLRAAGLDVRCGLLREAAHELNIGFISRMTRQRPWVRLKSASSLDGSTALASGISQWITGPEARADGHRWRARACAILTGIGTVRQDNPRLTVRNLPDGQHTTRQPLRVVIDSRLEIDPHAQVLAGGALIYTAVTRTEIHADLLQSLHDRGVEVVVLPNAHGKVDLPAMLLDLGRRGINELHVEAGYHLNGSLLREGCVDELLCYLAPKLLGPGLPIAALSPLQQLDPLDNAHQWAFCDVQTLGTDVRLRLRAPERSPAPAALAAIG